MLWFDEISISKVGFIVSSAITDWKIQQSWYILEAAKDYDKSVKKMLSHLNAYEIIFA